MLDIGTGTGRVLGLLSERTERALGLDASREMLSVARARLEPGPGSNVQLRHGDMYRLPFPAESFDLVTIHMVLHYADDPGRAIAEAARVLKPGGRMVVVDFLPHDREEMRRDHRHRHLGFADRDVARHAASAGLANKRPIHLPGDVLTVALWSAERPANDTVGQGDKGQGDKGQGDKGQGDKSQMEDGAFEAGQAVIGEGT